MAPKKRTSTSAPQTKKTMLQELKQGDTCSIIGKVMSKSGVKSLGLCMSVHSVTGMLLREANAVSS